MGRSAAHGVAIGLGVSGLLIGTKGAAASAATIPQGGPVSLAATAASLGLAAAGTGLAYGGASAELRNPKPRSTQFYSRKGATSLGSSRVWPEHHPFPKYLGGAQEQTLKKIPRKLHYRFHAALDTWKGGKYARVKTAKHFEGMSRSTVISDMQQFYREAEGGIFKKYLPDFEQAVLETLGGS